jgi:hypothetical protein
MEIPINHLDATNRLVPVRPRQRQTPVVSESGRAGPSRHGESHPVADPGGAHPPPIGSVKLKTGDSRLKVRRRIHEVGSMAVIDLLPDGAGDRHPIPFRLCCQRRGVACAITREASEAPFWQPRDADPLRLLRALADGPHRMIAVAARKVRLRPGEPVRLTADAFPIRRQASGGRRSPVNPVFPVGFAMPAVIVDVQVLTGGRQ